MKCAYCGTEFEVKNRTHKYCSKKCRDKAWKANNAERIAGLKRAWYAKNAKRRAEYYHEYYLAHREERLLKAKVWRMTGEWRLPRC